MGEILDFLKEVFAPDEEKKPEQEVSNVTSSPVTNETQPPDLVVELQDGQIVGLYTDSQVRIIAVETGNGVPSQYAAWIYDTKSCRYIPNQVRILAAGCSIPI